MDTLPCVGRTLAAARDRLRGGSGLQTGFVGYDLQREFGMLGAKIRQGGYDKEIREVFSRRQPYAPLDALARLRPALERYAGFLKRLRTGDQALSFVCQHITGLRTLEEVNTQRFLQRFNPPPNG